MKPKESIRKSRGFATANNDSEGRGLVGDKGPGCGSHAPTRSAFPTWDDSCTSLWPNESFYSAHTSQPSTSFFACRRRAGGKGLGGNHSQRRRAGAVVYLEYAFACRR